MKTTRTAVAAFIKKAQQGKTRPGKVPGGKAARRHPREFSTDSLVEGTMHELEHTTSVAVAMEIAMDHLAEDLLYYEKLAKVEKPSSRALTRIDDDTYTYASHTIAFSKPKPKRAGWVVTVSGPLVNTSMILSGQRDALARQAAGAIGLAKTMGNGQVKYGRAVR